MAVVSIYLLRDGRVAPVHRTVSLATPARDALRAVIAGPTAVEARQGFSSDVPAASRLRGVTVSDGLATVDVSRDFFAGTGTSPSPRVAEVVHTLTQFHTVGAVSILVDGVAAPGLAGLTRSAVEQWTPAILVEAPVAGQTVSSPLRVWGTSNTFEGAFRIRVTTADGRQLFDYPVQATSGTGTRGSFDVTVRFAVSGEATLQAYEVSMKDGAHVNVVAIPLTLQP